MKYLFFFIAGYLAIAAPPIAQAVTNDEDRCLERPTAVCLADIGVARAMAEDANDSLSQAPVLLAHIGRLDDAYELAEAKGYSTSRLLEYRVADALLAGGDVGELLGAEGVSENTVLLATLLLAGQYAPFDGLGLRPPQELQVRERVARIVDSQIGTIAGPITTASALLSLGEEDKARELLLSDRAFEPEPGPIPDVLIRLIGTERALEIYHARGELRPHDLGSLIRNEPDTNKAAALLDEMVTSATAIEEGERRRLALHTALGPAHAAGLEERVREIATGLLAEYRAKPELTWSDRSNMAKVLRFLGDAEPEVLALIQNLEQDVLASADIRRRDAFINAIILEYAEYGETDAILRLLPQTNFNWQQWSRALILLPEQIIRETGLSVAETVLSEIDVLLLRADLARALAEPRGSADAISWSEATTRNLLEGHSALALERLGEFHELLLKAALKMNDADLEDDVLMHSAAHAIESGDVMSVIVAAYHFHELRSGHTE